MEIGDTILFKFDSEDNIVDIARNFLESIEEEYRNIARINFGTFDVFSKSGKVFNLYFIPNNQVVIKRKIDLHDRIYCTFPRQITSFDVLQQTLYGEPIQSIFAREDIGKFMIRIKKHGKKSRIFIGDHDSINNVFGAEEEIVQMTDEQIQERYEVKIVHE